MLAAAVAVVAVLGAATVLKKRDRSRPTTTSEQPIAQNPEVAVSKGEAESEPLPSNDVPDTEDAPARADEIDRILGDRFRLAPRMGLLPSAAGEAPPLPPLLGPRRTTPLAGLRPPALKAKKPAPKRAKEEPPPSPTPSTAEADRLFEKRLQTTEAKLREQLLAVPELRLLSDEKVRAFRDRTFEPQGADRGLPQVQLSVLANLRLHHTLRKTGTDAGLPLQSGPSCRLDARTAESVQRISKQLRELEFVSMPGVAAAGNPPVDSEKKVAAFRKWCDVHKVETLRGTLATLLQMLQVEEVPTRLLLVRELEKVQSPEAGVALAKRAVMDLSPEVRQAAIAALGERPAGQYVPMLLQALRYPWAPVADHAAAALRTLKPEGAVPELVEMLDQPDPSAPVLDKKPKKTRQAVPELVRLNHFRNSLLCHAPVNHNQEGLVLAPIPTPGRTLQLQKVKDYYGHVKGVSFVRADITFLRQDFSVNLPVANAAPWPDEQRFDFVVRLRPLKPNEQENAAAPASDDYPQRQAVLYALRGITGKDGGASSKRWRELLAADLN